MRVAHAHHSAILDDGSDVGSNAWNADHTIVLDVIMVDNYATPQLAYVAAVAAGLPLVFTSGTTYTYTPVAGGVLQITAAVRIIAYGATIKATAGAYTNCDLINISGATGVTIEGGTWDWNNGTGTGNFLFNGTGNSGVTFRFGTYQNAIYGCIQLTDSSNLLFDSINLLSNDGGDINVICAGADVSDVVVHNTYHICPASNFEAINVVNLSGNTKFLRRISIRDVQIYGSSAPSVGSCGIQIWANSSNYNPGPFIISGCYVYGFEIGYSPAFCTGGAVTGNLCQAAKTIGFEMAGENLVCSGNVCEGDSITQYAFTTDGAPQGNFSGNSAREFTLYGFSVTNGGSDNAVFTGCHAYQTAVGAVSAFAIFGVNGVTLSGCHSNMPNSTGGLGVYALDVGNFTITGCSFRVASGTLGHIYLDNSTGTTRDNIKFKSNTFVGVVTPGNVNLIGASYGRTIDVEGLANAAVTQATSKATAIATTPAYQIDITMNNAALNAATVVSFNWPNVRVSANDSVSVTHLSGGTLAAYTFNTVCTNDNVSISVRNATAGNLSEAIVLRCILTKSKAS